MKKIKKALVGALLSGGIVLGGTLVSVAPAEAGVNQGRFCEPVGWTFHWKAKKFYDGEFVGYGPLRFRRSTAWDDCGAYVGI